MRFRLALFILMLARVTPALTQDTIHSAPGATVTGVVRDSIAHGPLVGAMVQLVAADTRNRFGRTAVSDSMGAFKLGDVPDGQYMLGFFHPMLDSLGVEPIVREVRIDRQRPVRADLAIPSPARLRAAICGAESAPSAGALVIGIVRDAQDYAPAAGATVRAEWLEFSFTRDGIVRKIPHLVATTGQNGWFALCNVPSAGVMRLLASRSADSTDRIEVEIPAEGFLRRELYVGPTRTIVIGDTSRSGDSLAPPPRRLHTGNGRLTGTVINAGGQPLAGASVGIIDGPQTRANDSGEWTLNNAPVGTRMLEVRAVGYFPDRRPVDVVPGARPVWTPLSTVKAVLDTVRVVASRRSRFEQSGFEERRHTGAGRYLTAKEIERRLPLATSEIFRGILGVRLDLSAHDETSFQMRGGTSDWCTPMIYFDGLPMRGLAAEDIDVVVRPHEILGIEIYSEASVPSQYQLFKNSCGAIVIWTKLGS